MLKCYGNAEEKILLCVVAEHTRLSLEPRWRSPHKVLRSLGFLFLSKRENKAEDTAVCVART
jgi:hypothetical protein